MNSFYYLILHCLLAYVVQATLQTAATVVSPVGYNSLATLEITLTNSNTDGYAPFVDLSIPGALSCESVSTPDSIPVWKSELTFGSTYQCLDHPLAKNSSGNFVQVCGSSFTLVTIELATVFLGADLPSQTLQVALRTPSETGVFSLYVRSGFLLGQDALLNPTTDPAVLSVNSNSPLAWPRVALSVLPTAFTAQFVRLSDSLSRTVTGPSYGVVYRISCNSAAMTLGNFTLSGVIPNGLVLRSLPNFTAALGSTVRVLQSPFVGSTLLNNGFLLAADEITSPFTLDFDVYAAARKADFSPLVEPGLTSSASVFASVSVVYSYSGSSRSELHSATLTVVNAESTLSYSGNSLPGTTGSLDFAVLLSDYETFPTSTLDVILGDGLSYVDGSSLLSVDGVQHLLGAYEQTGPSVNLYQFSLMNPDVSFSGPLDLRVSFPFTISDRYSSNTPIAAGDVIQSSTLLDFAPSSLIRQSNLDITGNDWQLRFHAINSVVCSNCSGTALKPGDLVTMAIRVTLPSGDLATGAYASVQLPRVVDGSLLGVFSATPSLSSGVTWGTAHTATTLAVPTITRQASRLTFTFGALSTTLNQAKTVELFFTLTILDTPIIDGHLSNFLMSVTDNGLAKQSSVQAYVPQPVLAVTLGAVATSSQSPAVVYSSNCTLCSAWSVGSAAVPSQLLTSAALAATPLNSDALSVQAGTRVKFVVTVENVGSAAAYDISVAIALPTGLQVPSGGANVVASQGTTSISSSGTSLFDTTGLRFATSTPARLLPYSSTSGQNLILISFELDVSASAPFGSTLPLGVSVCNYANRVGGQDQTNYRFNRDCLTSTSTVSLFTGSLTFTVVSTSDSNSGLLTGLTALLPNETATFNVDLLLPRGSGPLSLSFNTSAMSLISARVTAVGSGITGLAASVGSTFVGVPLSLSFGTPTTSDSFQVISLEVVVQNLAHNPHLLPLSLTGTATGLGLVQSAVVLSSNVQVLISYPSSQLRTPLGKVEFDEVLTCHYEIAIPHGSFDFSLSVAYPVGFRYTTNSLSVPGQLVGPRVASSLATSSSLITLDLGIFTNPNDANSGNDLLLLELNFVVLANTTFNPGGAVKVVTSTWTTGASSADFVVVVPTVTSLSVVAPPIDAYDVVPIQVVIQPVTAETIMYNGRLVVTVPRSSVFRYNPGTVGIASANTGVATTASVFEVGGTTSDSVFVTWPSISSTSSTIVVSFSATISAEFVVLSRNSINATFDWKLDAALAYYQSLTTQTEIVSKVPTVEPTFAVIARTVPSGNYLFYVTPGETVTFQGTYQLLQGYTSRVALSIQDLADYKFGDLVEVPSTIRLSNLSSSPLLATFNSNNTASASGAVNLVTYTSKIVVSLNRTNGDIFGHCLTATIADGNFPLRTCTVVKIVEPALSAQLVCSRILYSAFPNSNVNCKLNITHSSTSSSHAFGVNMTWSINPLLRVNSISASGITFTNTPTLTTASLGTILYSQFVLIDVQLHVSDKILPTTYWTSTFLPSFEYRNTPFTAPVNGIAPSYKLYRLRTLDKSLIPGQDFPGAAVTLNNTVLTYNDTVRIDIVMTFPSFGIANHTLQIAVPAKMSFLSVGYTSVGTGLLWTPPSIAVTQRTLNLTLNNLRVLSVINNTVTLSIVAFVEQGFNPDVTYGSALLDNWETRGYFEVVFPCIKGFNCFSGNCFGYYCACSSGVIGTTCNETAPVSCANSWHPLSNLLTENYPIIDYQSSKITNGDLIIRLFSPLVHNRTSTRLYLANPALYPACTGRVWQKNLTTINQSCWEEYTFVLPWIDAAACGWTVDNTVSGYSLFSNDVFVAHVDRVDYFRATEILRNTIHTMPIAIRLQTSIQISTQLTVFAPVNLLAALSKQEVIPGVLNSTYEGTLGFGTSMQWPFELFNGVIISLPPGVIGVLSSSSAPCNQSFGTACFQEWTLNLLPNGACSFSGAYQIQFQIRCRADPCPLTGDNFVNVTAVVVTEPFCMGVSFDVGLVGLLYSFKDYTHQNRSNSFFQNVTAHYMAALSTYNTADIQSSQFVSIRVTRGTTAAIYLMINSELTPAGHEVNLTLRSDTPADRPSFSIVTESNVLGVPTDSSVDFTVYATVDVSYVNGVRKRVLVSRQVISSGSQTTDVNTRLTVIPIPIAENITVTPNSTFSLHSDLVLNPPVWHLSDAPSLTHCLLLWLLL